MSHQLLAGKRGIIFGALDEQSIAWKVALQAHSEGASFTLTNAPVALRMGVINQLAEKTGSQVIGADVTLLPDLENLLKTSVETLGGKLDFILHSVGMSINVRKGKAYNDLDYDHMHKSMDISAMSFHRLLQTAEKLDVFNEHASVVALTYIAAQRVFPDYNEMAEAKAFLESIARSYGYHLGKNKKVRVNTISQSPTKTTAGSGIKGFGAFYNYADAISPLGNATADDCANYCVMMFSDYTRMVTMQNLFHDGGFSNTGVSKEVMEKFA